MKRDQYTKIVTDKIRDGLIKTNHDLINWASENDYIITNSGDDYLTIQFKPGIRAKFHFLTSNLELILPTTPNPGQKKIPDKKLSDAEIKWIDDAKKSFSELVYSVKLTQFDALMLGDRFSNVEAGEVISFDDEWVKRIDENTRRIIFSRLKFLGYKFNPGLKCWEINSDTKAATECD